MKRIVYIFFIVFYLLLSILTLTHANKFAFVSDKDGYVNIRDQPSIKSNIISTLKNREPVLCASTDDSPQFCFINFKNDGYGYVYKTRLDFFNKFQKINMISYTPAKVTYKKENIKVEVFTNEIDRTVKLKNNKAVINDKEILGTDGLIPTSDFIALNEIIVNNNGKVLKILRKDLEQFVFPRNGLGSAKNELADFDIYAYGDRIYIMNVFNNGGAGEYSLVLIIENGMLREKLFWRNTI